MVNNYKECEKCKKIIKAKKEIINNWVIVIVSSFVLLITMGIAPYFYYGGLFFFMMVIIYLIWCWRFIKKNNLYIKDNIYSSINKTKKEGEEKYQKDM